MAEYVNTKAVRQDIVYAHLVFDHGSLHSCHQAFCVFEDVPNKQYSPDNQSSDDLSLEYVQLISDSDSDSSSDSEHSYLDMDLEQELCMERAKHRCDSFGEGPYTKVKDTCCQKYQENKPPKPIIPKKMSKILCTGMSVLDDGRIVIATKEGQLLAFDAEGELLLMKDFKMRFEDITTVPKSEIAASCRQSIKIFNVEKSDIIEIEERCIDCFCEKNTTIYGLHYASNQYVISCKLQTQSIAPKPLILIIDGKGKVLKTFDITRLSSPKYIVCSSDAKHIFLTDQRNRTILALDHDGNIKWEATDLSIPKSLTIVGKNRLVVASEGCSSFKCFSFAGRMLKTIETETDKSCSPFLIHYHSSSKALLFCPEKQILGKQDSVYSLKIKKNRRSRLSNLLFSPFVKDTKE